MTIQSGSVIYHSDDSEQSIKEAREYIKRMKLTGDDVRIIRKDDAVMVVTKRSIWGERG